MASLDLSSTRFENYEDGSGEPLVLVHGSASDYRTRQAQRDAFAERLSSPTADVIVGLTRLSQKTPIM